MRRTVLGVFALLLMLAASGCAVESSTSQAPSDGTEEAGGASGGHARVPGAQGTLHSGQGGSATPDQLTVTSENPVPTGGGLRTGSERKGPHPEPWNPGDDDPK
jgi:hypothetical protein